MSQICYLYKQGLIQVLILPLNPFLLKFTLSSTILLISQVNVRCF